MAPLFLLFTLVPLLELYLLVRIGSVFGALNTVLLVIGTGIVGASLARREWRDVARQWRRAVETGRPPEDGMLSGALVFVGGLLLVTPGVFTDLLGLWLLLPFSRRAAARMLRRAFEQQVAAGRVRVTSFGVAPGRGGPTGPWGAPSAPSGGTRRPGTGEVIDTDGEDISEP